MQTEVGKVDILYRSIDRLERVIEQSLQGKHEVHYEQQPPFGFYSVMYLAEIRDCVLLFDPYNKLEILKKKIVEYPRALKDSIVRHNLWAAEFALAQVTGAIEREDVVYVAGCITRIVANLNQAIYALNEVYFESDKAVLDAIEKFDCKPSEYRKRVSTVSHIISSLIIRMHHLSGIAISLISGRN
jgi:hypothetical protein